MTAEIVILPLSGIRVFEDNHIYMLERLTLTPHCVLEAALAIWIESLHTGLLDELTIREHIEDMCEYCGIFSGKDPWVLAAINITVTLVDNILCYLNIPLNRFEIQFRNMDVVETSWMGDNILIKARQIA